MAKKISQLTQATEVKSDDVTVIVQDGETKKLPLNMMVTKQDIENKKIAGLAKLDEIEATYENDTYTPTITVKNKSSVKTGEGDEVDYSANVMDGHAKSAILSGQTLINHAQITEYDFNNGRIITQDLLKPLEIGKTYTIIMNIVSQTTTTGITTRFAKDGSDYTGIKTFNGLGLHKYSFTPTIDFNQFAPYIDREEYELGLRASYNQLMILEGDYTNIDIPYFEGMQSVKMPVLKTVGKNLFDGELVDGYIDTTTGIVNNWSSHFRTKNYIKIIPNTKYVLNKTTDFGENVLALFFYDINKNFINVNQVYYPYSSCTSPQNAEYVLISGAKNSMSLEKIKLLLQLEEGSTATPYEPYKSNILTANEDLELRGIGDIKDELNLLTGEVTERIGEIVLDGSEDWKLANPVSNNNNNLRLYCTIETAKSGLFTKGVISNRFATVDTVNYEGIAFTVANKNLHLSINKTKLDEISVNGFKQWLSQNPVTVQYHLETESIKTVDLMPSGTHPSTTPYCWKNGLIQLSSSGLLPNLEYSVVTSRAGQINQNATMIVKNDKRIFDLEILLAGGLVNTTYQALTLQNQVETGLSKVSLNSETEPDYLLYHMIMKLIEEKAYKLDDLTEKVSVFYLYEKLSDEQFETIYSALYPFVEDEIVEEPVVEELPEVVEDEVIM